MSSISSFADATSQTVCPKATITTALILCDSRGILVGILATHGLGWPEGDGFAHVARPLNGTMISLKITRNGFVDYLDGDQYTFLFKSSDCSGRRYLPADGLPLKGIVGGKKLYYPDVTAIDTVTFSSYLGLNQCNTVDPFTLVAAPSIRIPWD